MQSNSRRARRSTNYWPGFVDALSTLVMVVIFVLLVFMVAQFFLSSALSGRDAALARLTQQINQLTDLLALEKSNNEDLRVSMAQLSADLQGANEAKDDLTGQLAALLDSKAELEALLATAEQKLVINEKELKDAYGAIDADKETIEAQLADLAVLKSLKEQLDAALAAATSAASDKDQEITRLQAQIKQLEAKLAETQSALAAAQIALSASQQDVTAGQQALATAQSETSETENALAESMDEVAKLRTALAEALTKLATAQALLESKQQAVDATQQNLSASQAQLAQNQAALADAQAQLKAAEDKLAALQQSANQGQQALAEQSVISEEAQRQVELLNAQLAALRQQLARIATALEASEAKNQDQEVEIANLGARLNEALATKVQELARYRSEFFGRLRELLGNRQDIRIVGDRFVFQSEVLFASGQAVMGDGGRAQIDQLAETLKQLIPQIPPEIDWVLQVNGHTDKRPVVSAAYASNWELSQARALSVVRALIADGIPPERLVAAGYAEFQPLDPADTDEAYAQNRRIEIKLTER